ncbi:MAG: (2Fe-2S)-binding protein [Vicinamibacteria bacterium]|nr:(2Fe-2S)-binding protein [Vicinamibacteria bacterium]
MIFDGREIPFVPGQTILQAAEDAGAWIPRLCHKPGLEPYGSCRVCVVRANGRTVSSCTFPASLGMVVECDTPDLLAMRKLIVEMLFVEGNHFCMSCEKSGHCELQALGYRLGITAPQLEYQFPRRQVDASHPDVLIDHNRCILCTRCVRTSRDLDGKDVFAVVGRGPHRRIAASAGTRLRDSGADVSDRAVDACPVGALLRKRVGFSVPVGLRPYDAVPIGSQEVAR